MLALVADKYALLRTLASEDDGQVPQLRHVVSLEDLALVGGTVSVERQSDVLLVLVLARKRDTSANRDLGADDTVSSVETRCEHVHGATLSVCDTLSPSEQFTDDGLDSGSAHQGETVAAVGGDDMVGAFDGVFNSDSDSFLTSRQVAETANLLFFVEPVGGHFHASVVNVSINCLEAVCTWIGNAYRMATMS